MPEGSTTYQATSFSNLLFTPLINIFHENRIHQRHPWPTRILEHPRRRHPGLRRRPDPPRGAG